MVTVEFAPALQRHVNCAPQSVAPGTLREVLEAALRAAPELAHYVFDDQRAVRAQLRVPADCLHHHVVVPDGEPCTARFVRQLVIVNVQVGIA